MKTSKTMPPSSSDKAITLSIPRSWLALTDEWRLYLCTIMAQGHHTPDEIKALMLARMAHVRHTTLARITLQLAELMPMLDWIDQPPTSPARLTQIGTHPALDPMLDGVPLRTYLEVENYYQGNLMTQAPEALTAIGQALYPGTEPRHFGPPEHLMLMMWLVGLKAEYANLFPHLFSHTANPATDTPPDPRQTMVTLLRALTGGDITKQQAVLSTPTLDALTELDAKAEEAAELKAHTNH